MHICLDISAALGQGAGIGRYARELALALHRLPDGPKLTLFHNRVTLERMPVLLSGLPRVEIPLGNKTWRSFLLTGAALPAKWSAFVQDCDLFHGTDAIAPWTSLPTVLTIHDLSTTLFPEHHTRLHRLFARVSLPRMAQHAAAIIADSTATQRDIVERLRIPRNKMHVIYLGVDHSCFFPRDRTQAQQAVKQTLGINAPFILAVGTLEPRKNLVTLLRAFAKLGTESPTLALVGAQGWGRSQLFDLVRDYGLEQRIVFTGYVADDMLPNLYAGAEYFVYPSLYEGFGLPVLEALACGTPVITSNTSSLSEVAGNAALTVDPSNADELAVRMRELMENEDLRARLCAAGPPQASQFSWERTALETMSVYSSVIA